jgi:NitT/TauT family transport system permease protein
MTINTGGLDSTPPIPGSAAPRLEALAGLMPLLYALLGLGTILLVWEAVVVVFRLPDYTLPGVGAVIRAVIQERSLLASAVAVTTIEIVLSFIAAMVLGMVAAIALHWWPKVAAVLWPLIIFAKITPQVAVAPLLIVVLGLGLTSKVSIAVLLAFFPALVATYVGFKSVPADVLELARSMRIGRVGTFLHFELPASLPHIFSGAKIAMGSSVIGAIVAEFISSNAGLGYTLLVAMGSIETALVMAVIVILGLEGSILYWLVSLAERFAIRWHISQRRR